MFIRLIKFISFALLLLLNSHLSAEIKLTLDRTDIRVNETFQLTLNIDDPKSLTANQTMDFLPAEFQLLGSQNFQKSTVVNRQFANSMGWNLTLIANQAGTYTIPKFSIGNEQSEPFTVRILPAIANVDELNPNSKVKLTAQVNNDEVYVQQQIIYSVRIYSSVPSRRHYLSPLQIENAIVKKLGEPSEFQMVSKGVRYNVKEEKYVIFPQKSGQLRIPPILFKTNIVDTQASYGSLSRYRPIELQSKPFDISVRSRPQTASLPWVPAKELKLTAEWQSSNQDFEVGKPATLDLYVKGVGLLPEQLPNIEFPEVDGLKIYRDKPVLQSRIGASGVTSYHLEKLAVIPNKAGEVTIPKVKVAYWNTLSDSQSYAELEPITISVAQSQAAIALPAVSQQVATEPTASQVTVIKNNPLWQYLTLTFAILWLATLGAYWLKKPKRLKQAETVTESNQSNLKTQSLSLKQAATESNPANLAQSIIEYVSSRTGVKITNLNQVIHKCSSPELKEQLTALQSALYSSDRSPQHYDGQKIYKLLQSLDFSTANLNNDNGLPPLYPE